MDNEMSFWTKKPDDLTAGESIAYVGALTAVAVAAPLAALVAFTGAARLYEKVRNRYSDKPIEITESK